MQEEGINLEDKIKTLSRGQKQLVKILQALVNEGDLIIFDEPTHTLDYITGHKILQLLAEPGAEGRTVIFSTTGLNQAEQIADRAGILRGLLQ